MEEPILRRTWAEIDLDALAHNYQQARRKIGPNVKYLGVVKADAYGHGAIQVSRKLEQLGADYLAVSSLDEAKELRRAGIQAPILILGHTPPAMVPQLIEYGITQAVSALAKAEAYSAAAVESGGTLKVHIKVDTGMSRLGFLVREGHFDTGVESIAAACALPGLEAEGIFTHFAVSDEDDRDSEASRTVMRWIMHSLKKPLRRAPRPSSRWMWGGSCVITPVFFPSWKIAGETFHRHLLCRRSWGGSR